MWLTARLEEETAVMRKKMKMESEAQMEIREMGYGDADILQHPFGYVSCGS